MAAEFVRLVRLLELNLEPPPATLQKIENLLKPGLLKFEQDPERVERVAEVRRALKCIFGEPADARVRELKAERDVSSSPLVFNPVSADEFRKMTVGAKLDNVVSGELMDAISQETFHSRHLSQSMAWSLVIPFRKAMQRYSVDPKAEEFWNWQFFTRTVCQRFELDKLPHAIETSKDSTLFQFARSALLRRVLHLECLEVRKFEPRRVMFARLQAFYRDSQDRVLFCGRGAKKALGASTRLSRFKLADFRSGSLSHFLRLARVPTAAVVEFLELKYDPEKVFQDQGRDETMWRYLLLTDFALLVTIELEVLDEMKQTAKFEGYLLSNIQTVESDLKRLMNQFQFSDEDFEELASTNNLFQGVVSSAMAATDWLQVHVFPINSHYGQILSKFSSHYTAIKRLLGPLSLEPEEKIARQRQLQAQQQREQIEKLVQESNVSFQDESEQQLVDYVLEHGLLRNLQADGPLPEWLVPRLRAAFGLNVNDSGSVLEQRLLNLLTPDYLRLWLKSRENLSLSDRELDTLTQKELLSYYANDNRVNKQN